MSFVIPDQEAWQLRRRTYRCWHDNERPEHQRLLNHGVVPAATFDDIACGSVCCARADVPSGQQAAAIHEMFVATRGGQFWLIRGLRGRPTQPLPA